MVLLFGLAALTFIYSKETNNSVFGYNDNNDDNNFSFGDDNQFVLVDEMKNLDKFLLLISTAESNNDYYVINGPSKPANRFIDDSDHPFILRPNRIKFGASTASGAFQIIVGTWRDLGGKNKYGSFNPAAQRAAAIDLIKRRGAYADILRGRFEIARSKLLTEWDFFNRSKWNVAGTLNFLDNIT